MYRHANTFAHVISYATNGRRAGGIVATTVFLTPTHPVLTQLKSDNERSRWGFCYRDVKCVTSESAYQALGGYNGAVVALEPKTGKFWRWYPSRTMIRILLRRSGESVVPDSSSSVLLNRATQDYTRRDRHFKIPQATLAFMRRQPDAYKTFDFTCDSRLTVGDMTINCYSNNAHEGPEGERLPTPVIRHLQKSA